MSKKYVVANWKMNMSLSEVQSWKDKFGGLELSNSEVDVIIAPSYIHFGELSGWTRERGYFTAGQDISVFPRGAHTGDVGVFQLEELSSHCIVGHSERKEDRELVRQKQEKCLDSGVTPIFCFVDTQAVAKVYKDGTILAWEDPENISIGGEFRAKDPEDIKKAVRDMRENLPPEAVLLYGGSVNRANIKDLAAIEGLDGVLVGSASLDPEHFFEIVSAYEIR